MNQAEPIVFPLWIDGQAVNTEQTTMHYRVYDGQELGLMSQATEKDVYAAISAAQIAQKKLAKMPAHERADKLRALATYLHTHQKEAAHWIVDETAKPIKYARAEILRSITTYELAAEEARRLNGENIVMDAVRGGEGKTAFTRFEPLGVGVAITPFNFPFNLVAHKLGPAIAAGNAVVLKPSSQTPGCALWIARAFEAVGFPAGTVNVIIGSGAKMGQALVQHPSVRIVSFTGSEAVGEQLLAWAGIKRTIMELGSNSAVLLDENVDLARVVPKLIQGAFSFSGQVCISIQRIVVHQHQIERLGQLLVEAVKSLKRGDPHNEETDISVMINSNSTQNVRRAIEDACSEGAQIITGGEVDGSYLHPTILQNCELHQKVINQELFAPVVILQAYTDWHDAIHWINQSRYGLNTGVFSNNWQRAWEAARELESGAVLINEIPTYRADHMPYGGVKQSGIGREGVKYAIREWSHEKLIICAEYN